MDNEHATGVESNTLPDHQHPRNDDFRLPKEGNRILKFRDALNSDCFKCVVCGDKPTGVHYEVLSCNGCKAFFRRTIISGRSYKCAKDGKCSFDRDFRCACRSCRFDMCINMGMNAKAIKYTMNVANMEFGSSPDNDDADDAALPSTSAVVLAKRKRKAQPQPVPRLKITPSDGLLSIHDLLADLVIRETKTNELREKWTLYSDASLDELLREPCLLGTEHRHRFQEWKGTLDDKFMCNPIRYWTVVDLRLTIEYAKSFSVFRELNNADQRALLSHIGCVLVMLNQALYSARKNHGTMIYPDGTIAMKAVDSGRCSSAFHRDSLKWVYEQLCLPVYTLRDIASDDNVFALLKAIAFLSPLDDFLSEHAKVVLQREREKHMDALSRLLLTKEGKSGPTKMAALMSALQMLFNINEKKRDHLRLFDVASNLSLSNLGKEIQLRQHL